MSEPNKTTIVGKIIEVIQGSKKINKGYTHGYLRLILLSNKQRYVVFISQSKINDYGFLPKSGHWVEVHGSVSKLTVKKVLSFKHIEPPLTAKLLDQLRSPFCSTNIKEK